IRPKPAERSKSQPEDQDRRQDDAPWRKAIEQYSNSRRHQGHGDGRQSKCAANRFALPAESSVQWVEEEAERVRNDGSKAGHHTQKGCGSHTPSGVVDRALVRKCGANLLCHPWLLLPAIS